MSINLDRVKEMLETEPTIEYPVPEIRVTPILHNEDLIILQFLGWSIDLNKDGTWNWEDTSGG